jgi:hypothetical protein
LQTGRTALVEQKSLRSQIVTLKRGKHSKYLPFAFTEQGGCDAFKRFEQ